MSSNRAANNNTAHNPPSISEASSDGGRGGIQFGTSVAYDDAYAGSAGGGEFVKSLPTLEEEHQMMMEHNDDVNRMSDAKKREWLEEQDMGRMAGMGASHPSSRVNYEKQKVC